MSELFHYCINQAILSQLRLKSCELIRTHSAEREPCLQFRILQSPLKEKEQGAERLIPSKEIGQALMATGESRTRKKPIRCTGSKHSGQGTRRGVLEGCERGCQQPSWLFFFPCRGGEGVCSQSHPALPHTHPLIQPMAGLE